MSYKCVECPEGQTPSADGWSCLCAANEVSEEVDDAMSMIKKGCKACESGKAPNQIQSQCLTCQQSSCKCAAN